jgi:hypothetical protein
MCCNEWNVELGKTAIRMRQHPAVWMRPSGVVIRNPEKDPYTNIKASRSITLHSYIVRVVKIVVAELLAEVAER